VLNQELSHVGPLLRPVRHWYSQFSADAQLSSRAVSWGQMSVQDALNSSLPRRARTQ
jgi:hypothetical protein